MPKNNARATLVEGLCADDPSRNRASIDKKVRGWLNGRYQPTAREDLLELCFVLRLSTADADAFLAMAGEEGKIVRYLIAQCRSSIRPPALA